MQAFPRSIPSLISGLLLLAGCAVPTDAEGAGNAALHEPDSPPLEQIVFDAGAGAPVGDEHTRAVSEPNEPRLRIQCDGGFAPFVCDGGCPAGQGCCITGIRPTGICQSLDDCGYQCEVDCAMARAERSEREGLQCHALCTWVAPEPICVPDP